MQVCLGGEWRRLGPRRHRRRGRAPNRDADGSTVFGGVSPPHRCREPPSPQSFFDFWAQKGKFWYILGLIKPTLDRPGVNFFGQQPSTRGIAPSVNSPRCKHGISFTCHPYVYPHVVWAIPAFTSQPQSFTAIWPVLISHPSEARRLLSRIFDALTTILPSHLEVVCFGLFWVVLTAHVTFKLSRTTLNGR